MAKKIRLKIKAEELKRKLRIKDGVDGKDGLKGADGKPGKDADTHQIASVASKIALQELLPQIPKLEDYAENLPIFGEEIRDGLELLKGEERLDASAIKNLPKLIENKIVGGGSIARNFYQLFDVPQTYLGNEGDSLRVNATGTGLEYYTPSSDTDEKVKYDAGDPTAGYVADKFVAGTGISLAEGTGANENKLEISASATPQVYPGAGIALSTGSAWDTSITDNSANWNTAYGWGDHAGLYDIIGTASGLIGTHESTYDHTLIATALQSETDPLSLHLDQTSAQTFTGGAVTGTGLLKVTAGLLGLDTSTYLPSFSASDTQILFWDSTAPAGNANFTWDKTNVVLTLDKNGASYPTILAKQIASGAGTSLSLQGGISLDGAGGNLELWGGIGTTTFGTINFNTAIGTNIDATGYTITGTSLVTVGGTSSQFVKGDGSLDSSTYLTSAVGTASDTEVLYNNAGTPDGTQYLTYNNATGDFTLAADHRIYFRDAAIYMGSGTDGYLDFDADIGVSFNAPKATFFGSLLPAIDASYDLGAAARWRNLLLSGTIGNGTQVWTMPASTGTLALTSDIPATPTIDAVLTAGNTSASNSMTLTAGTLTAEQLTSTDDITMAGLLTNIMTADDTLGYNFDGKTNPYTGSTHNFGFFTRNRTIDASVLTGAKTFRFEDIDFTNNRIITGSGGNSINVNTMNTVGLYVTGAHSYTATGLPTNKLLETNTNLAPIVSRTGTLTSGTTTIENIAEAATVSEGIGYNNGAGKTLTVNNFGAKRYIYCSGTLTAGTMVKNNYGDWIQILGTSNGTVTSYGYYISSISGTTSWGFYNNDNDAHNFLGKDNVKTYFGTGVDASIYYDGTDLVINTAEVGSGGCKINTLNVRANGTIQPVQLADASAANDSIYYSTTASKLVYKDAGGTVNNLY